MSHNYVLYYDDVVVTIVNIIFNGARGGKH